MTPYEAQQITEKIASIEASIEGLQAGLNKKFEHKANNIANQIAMMQVELEKFQATLNKHEHNAAVSQLELQRKIDQVLTALEGTSLDRDTGLFARFKRLEVMVEVLKADKQFMKGGWWVVVKVSSLVVGLGSFIILIYKTIWK